MTQRRRRNRTVPGSLPAAARRTIHSIASGYAPRQIWLHGSFARGDPHEGSDLDLIIIKDTATRFADRIEEVLQFCPGGIAVEALVYTPEEVKHMLAQRNAFVERSLSEGVLVYEQQS